MLADTAWFKRRVSPATALGATLRLGMSKSSASSTTAVLITTPGDTPIPFLISIKSKEEEEGGRRKRKRPRRFPGFILYPSSFILSSLFFAKLALKQLRQFLHGAFGVHALGFDADRRPLRRRKNDHLHHALAVGLRRLIAPPLPRDPAGKPGGQR